MRRDTAQTILLISALGVLLSVVYKAEPAGVVTVDAAGLVKPQANGTATIHASVPAGPSAHTQIIVGNDFADTRRSWLDIEFRHGST